MPENSDVAPGVLNADQWRPYKLWAGDKWECEGCGAQIVVGVAQRPIAEHYQPEFAKYATASQLQVNDC